MNDRAILYMNGCVIPVELMCIEMSAGPYGKKIEIREISHCTVDFDEMRYRFEREMKAKYTRFKPPLFSEPKVRDLKESDIKEVIFNGPATIIKWADNTKTVVKCQDEDKESYSPEAGIAIAVMKKVFGNKGNYNNIFNRLLKKAKR